MGRELLAVPPKFSYKNSYLLSLYREHPLNSSLKAPERNDSGHLLARINRQLSESIALRFSFIAEI